jgi:hypothetical protein
MRKVLGFLLFLVGSYMLVAPEALLGLQELKWMAKQAFPGEILLGIVIVCFAYYLLDLKPGNQASKASH